MNRRMKRTWRRRVSRAEHTGNKHRWVDTDPRRSTKTGQEKTASAEQTDPNI